MEKELEISRYKLAEAEEKKQEVVKKIDELSQETDQCWMVKNGKCKRTF